MSLGTPTCCNVQVVMAVCACRHHLLCNLRRFNLALGTEHTARAPSVRPRAKLNQSVVASGPETLSAHVLRTRCSTSGPLPGRPSTSKLPARSRATADHRGSLLEALVVAARRAAVLLLLFMRLIRHVLRLLCLRCSLASCWIGACRSRMGPWHDGRVWERILYL